MEDDGCTSYMDINNATCSDLEKDGTNLDIDKSEIIFEDDD